jgi:thiol-disulfide isomerase/thioredoxin
VTWRRSARRRLAQFGATDRRRPAGKVVLVDFWTYTCINWLRTLPYVRAWAAQYKDQGLVVIGVHTPEFSFEEDSTTFDSR